MAITRSARAEHFAIEIGGIATRDAEGERMMIEQAARRQRRGENGAAAVGKSLDCRFGTGPQHAASAEHDGTFRRLIRSMSSATCAGSGCGRPPSGMNCVDGT